MKTRQLWYGFIAVIVISFGVLLFFGREIYRKAPPIPAEVVTTGGQVLFTGQDIRDGQNIWQSIGGHEVGTVWGHGSYVAPDWTADWLHRESVYILDYWADTTFHKPYQELTRAQQAVLKVNLQQELRTNGYDPATDRIVVSPVVAQAISSVSRHYEGLFMNDPSLKKLRDAYAVPENSIKDPSRMAKMNAFFFWATWACVTNRPGSEITYTNNWPPEELVANQPTASLILWTGFSVIMLLAGIGLMVWYHASRKENGDLGHEIPATDPLSDAVQTPSMKATLKYFWVVTAL